MSEFDRLLAQFAAPEYQPLTSGSSGAPRRCVHSPTTLRAAAEAFAQRFPQLRNAVNVLPPGHVSSLMPRLRCACVGGSLFDADYRDPSSWRSAPFALQSASISLVPTQLNRLLHNPLAIDCLRDFAAIFLGGGPAHPQLLARARSEALPIAPCYGMSESAAMVCALDPADFLNGRSGVGKPLPHAKLSLIDGILHVASPAICHGYNPPTARFQRDPFPTFDRAECDADGFWHILGRADRVIISGGLKIHPETIESLALTLPAITAARCTASPDPDWGQRIALHFTTFADADPQAATAALASLCRQHLPPHAVPKAFLHNPNAKLSPLLKWQNP